MEVEALNERNKRRLTVRFPRLGLARFSPVVLLGALAMMVGVPVEAAADSKQVGKASWYGPGFHGKRTASGQTFDPNRLTAAHRNLPLGSRARVTNLRNGRMVEVTINDRGPHGRGRIIDLSRAAARELAIGGVALVSIEAIQP